MKERKKCKIYKKDEEPEKRDGREGEKERENQRIEERRTLVKFPTLIRILIMIDSPTI